MVGYVRVKVRPYVPSPLRCFRCLRFGHTRDFCRGRKTCEKCSSNEHVSDECTAGSPRCVKCDDTQTPHSAFDRSCPALLREKEILALKVTKNLTFREARDQYNATHPKRPYASAVREVGLIRPESEPQPEPQQENISQLISLLRSFDLTLTSPGVLPGSATLRTPQPSAVAYTAGRRHSDLPGQIRGSPQVRPGRWLDAGPGPPGLRIVADRQPIACLLA